MAIVKIKKLIYIRGENLANSDYMWVKDTRPRVETSLTFFQIQLNGEALAPDLERNVKMT